MEDFFGDYSRFQGFELHFIKFKFFFTRILENCKNLQLLDISYCRQIEESYVTSWMKSYPSVSIKRIWVKEVN